MIKAFILRSRALVALTTLAALIALPDSRAGDEVVPAAVSAALASYKIDSIELQGDSDEVVYNAVGKNAIGLPVSISLSADGSIRSVAIAILQAPTPVEVLGQSSSGTKVDSDGDGVPNVEEVDAGTNPDVADTDGDGFSDGIESSFSGDALNANNVPEVLTIHQTNGRSSEAIIVLNVATAPGIDFQVEVLNVDDGRWTPLGEKISGDGATHAVPVPKGSQGRGAMFRVAISN